MQLKIYVPKHPLIEHLTNVIQSVDMPPVLVRNSAIELAYWLCYEAVRSWISLTNVKSNTLDGLSVTQLMNPDEKVLAVSFVKSGLLMNDSIRRLLSNIQLFYVSFTSSELSCNVSEEDRRLFKQFVDYSKFLILDSVILSSDKILAVLSMMVVEDINISSVRLVCLFCSSQVLQDIGQVYPNLTIYTSCVKDVSNIADLSAYKALLGYLQT